MVIWIGQFCSISKPLKQKTIAESNICCWLLAINIAIEKSELDDDFHDFLFQKTYKIYNNRLSNKIQKIPSVSFIPLFEDGDSVPMCADEKAWSYISHVLRKYRARKPA